LALGTGFALHLAVLLYRLDHLVVPGQLPVVGLFALMGLVGGDRLADPGTIGWRSSRWHIRSRSRGLPARGLVAVAIADLAHKTPGRWRSVMRNPASVGSMSMRLPSGTTVRARTEHDGP
jgi:hypothetical protein